LLAIIVLAAGTAWYRRSQEAREAAAERRRLLTILATVDVADGVDATEAMLIAKAFYEATYGGLEGGPSAPIDKDGYWVSTVRIGFAGTPDREPILINPRTGGVQGPIAGVFKTFTAFKKYLAGIPGQP
jgi:hypothetical protein